MTIPAPQVSLVGAGPGDPGLLTVRALECLAQADVVIYDQLVPAQLLEYAPPHAERICVTQLAPCHLNRVPEIEQLMIDAARKGKRVVRLKGGDPFIFGRGGEEALALRQAGVSYEVVPGITAALAAATCAGIPLTHRLHASAVAFVTGHEQPGKAQTNLDWEALARFPGTLVFYMGIARLTQNVEALVLHGKPADTPAAIVRWAGTNQQQTLEAPLAELPLALRQAKLTAPALVLIGDVVGLRSQLAWFEQRPLFGKRILVTRPRHQAGEFVRQLQLLGGTCTVVPAVEIREPGDWGPVDAALSRLDSFDWLAFTSVNGVHAFMRRLRHLGRDLRALGGLRLAAIGPSTADALRAYHLEPDVVPAEFRSEALAEELRQRVTGQRVLLARADRGRDLLRLELASVAQVEQIAVYSQTDTPDLPTDIFQEIDYVTLTSSNIARAILTSLDAESSARIQNGLVQLVTISPVTSATVRDLGLPVSSEATTFTTRGLIEALLLLQK